MKLDEREFIALIREFQQEKFGGNDHVNELDYLRHKNLWDGGPTLRGYYMIQVAINAINRELQKEESD